MGIPKLVVLLVLVLYSFLIISCLIYQTKKYFYLHNASMPTKWLVLQTNDTLVSTKMQTLVIIGKQFKKQICITKTLFILFCCGRSFNDIGFPMVPLA